MSAPDNPADLIETAMAMVRFLADITARGGFSGPLGDQGLSEAGEHGLYLILTQVEATLSLANARS